jgi:hypothetical protein
MSAVSDKKLIAIQPNVSIAIFLLFHALFPRK